jgi:FkbM family methyltransferase
MLTKNLKLNKCNNVKVFNQALSNNNYKTKFNWISPNNPGASGLENNPMGNLLPTSENQKTQCVSIDSLKLPKLDFIKLDIEGYEPLAIEGAINTIKKYKPTIALECWSDHKGNASLENTKHIHQNLIQLGYSVIQLSHSDYLFVSL